VVIYKFNRGGIEAVKTELIKSLYTPYIIDGVFNSISNIVL